MQSLKIALPQDLIDRDCDRVGEVQRAQTLPHGEPYATVGVGVEEVLGQTLCLLPEEQENGGGVADVGIKIFRFGGEAIEIRLGVLGKKVLQTIVIGDVEVVPIVQTRALELAVVNLKAERTDEVERRARGGTGARDVARVLRDFGLMKYDIDGFHIQFPFVWMGIG